jgi:DNA-binding transcriptional ArsR family regulator
MGWWQVSADTLAGSRFVPSTLAETTAALIVLHADRAAHPGERAWLDTHRPAYRAHLAADPVTALLVRTGIRPGWIADLFTAPPFAPDPIRPGDGERGFAAELARLRAAGHRLDRSGLEAALNAPLPAALDGQDLPELAADLLAWVWAHAVRPTWPRRRRIIEADIVARTGRLGQDGWAGALDRLRPGTRWLGEGRLQINAHDYPPREISGAQLSFVPVTPWCGWVSWDEPHRYAVVYPCSGVLAADAPSAPDALSALLGPARARVLVLLGTPLSTTQLTALTGQGLGSVGRHLKILLDAHLIQRRRAARSVLYTRTPAGDTLVHAQHTPPATSAPPTSAVGG